MESLIGNGFELNTLKGYNTSVKHLSGFLKTKFRKTDVEIKSLDHAFIVDFEYYLKSVCKCSGVSAAKYIKQYYFYLGH